MSDCKQVCICRDTRLRSFTEKYLHYRLAQGRRQAEGSVAHSPAREPRIRTVRDPRHLYDALQRRHQDPRRVPHLPWPPEPAGPHSRQGSPVDREHHRERRRSHGRRMSTQRGK